MKIIAKSIVLAAAVAAAFTLNVARASVEVGKPAPDFTLTDIAIKAGKPIEKTATRPYGCGIKY